MFKIKGLYAETDNGKVGKLSMISMSYAELSEIEGLRRDIDNENENHSHLDRGY